MLHFLCSHIYIARRLQELLKKISVVSLIFFSGLHVALKCKNAKGEFETKALAKVDKSGAYSVPLAADLLRQDGELKQNCFAQLHSASHQPCPGQEPSWIVRLSSIDDDKKKTSFVVVAGKMHYSSKECASAFLCDPFHKKHLLHKKPVMIPHLQNFHKRPALEYSHPTPVPEYKPPTPMPTYKPPTPEYSHPSPTPIYHPPADQMKAQNPETDPEMFKKLLPFIKKQPFFYPKFKKFPPGNEEIKA
ncbi:hypothetical protein PR202_ga08089 [Eleusine coracana subsp. coracana]|uniref:Proline-rich protein n=1 Tax=Eleusine coracana subsp. coracana TaxID=191504 RepID=A0AAV5C0F1_ELECO|nr:hypothetical protein PR202_ga08089 [Eleusine coracana subsp. coracana]